MKYYGDRLMYEPLESKWSRCHATHCGCCQGWLTHIRHPRRVHRPTRGKPGYYSLVGPGPAEGVDESALTALWETLPRAHTAPTNDKDQKQIISLFFIFRLRHRAGTDGSRRRLTD
jgi:hypothetical protein